MMTTIKIKPGIYQHFKGSLYQVFHTCKHSETEETMVFYQSLYGDYSFWVRPLTLFKSKVIYEGKEKQRFTLIQALQN